MYVRSSGKFYNFGFITRCHILLFEEHGENCVSFTSFNIYTTRVHLRLLHNMFCAYTISYEYECVRVYYM